MPCACRACEHPALPDLRVSAPQMEDTKAHATAAHGGCTTVMLALTTCPRAPPLRAPLQYAHRPQRDGRSLCVEAFNRPVRDRQGTCLRLGGSPCHTGASPNATRNSDGTSGPHVGGSVPGVPRCAGAYEVILGQPARTHTAHRGGCPRSRCAVLWPVGCGVGGP